MTPDSTNFDFIINAFTTVDVEPDAQKTPPPSNTNAWELTFDNSELELYNIDLTYEDVGQVKLNTHVGKLQGGIKSIDLNQLKFQTNYLRLSDSDIGLTLYENKNTDTITVTNPLAIYVQADAANIEHVIFDLTMPTVEFYTDIQQLKSSGTLFDLQGSKVLLNMATAEITKTDIRYEVPGTPTSQGFDYKHMDLKELNATLTDVAYKGTDSLTITMDIQQLSSIANKDFKLNHAEGYFSFAQKELILDDFVFQTDRSDLTSKHTVINYPFIGVSIDPMSQFGIETDLIADLKNSSDLSYFYPPLDTIAFFRKNKKYPLQLTSNIKGNLEDKLNMETFDLKLPGLRANLVGEINHLLQQDKLRWNIQLKQFKTTKNRIVDLIPDNVLPEYIQLPDSISLFGTSSGTIQDFKTRFTAVTNRLNEPVATQLRGSGRFKKITQRDKAWLDVQVDTLYTSRTDILAYLPPNTIPDYVTLPEYFILTGTVNGPFSKLESKLDLLTYRNQESNQVKAIGSISGLFTSDKPTFNIELDAASFSQQELKAFLPDSLLPAYFELPFIKKLSGFFTGDFDNFSTNFKLESNTGEWNVDANLKQDAYKVQVNIDDFKAEKIFIDGYLDSLTGMPIIPLTVNVQMEGKGFSMSDTSFSNFLIQIKSAADEKMQGLRIEGKLDKNIMTATATANESEVAVVSDFKLDYNNTLPEWQLDMLLDSIDLQALGYSKVPFVMRGQLEATAKGYTLNDLNGTAKLSDFQLLYKDSLERIDSVLLLANLDSTQTKVSITSDFLDASLVGKLQIPQAITALQQQIYNYWKTDYPDSLVGKTNDYFDITFQLHRPVLLTMGFVPGLNYVTPFDLTGSYNNTNGSVDISTEIPYLEWQNSVFEKLTLEAKGDDQGLDYELTVEKASVEEKINLNNFTSFGHFANNVLENTMLLVDEEQQKRFEIKSTARFSNNDGFQISLAPGQLLNYEQWAVSKNNEVSWIDGQLEINDWRLYTNKQSIAMTTSEKGSLDFAFQQFDLDIFADLLKLPVDRVGKLKDKTSVSLDGILNGTLSFPDLKQPMAMIGTLKVDDLVVFDAPLGHLNLDASTETGKTINTVASLLGNGNDLKISGKIDLDKKFDAFDFKLDMPALNLSSVEPLLFGYVENMEGFLTGKLQINGSLEQPDLSGKVNFKDAAFDLELAKTRLKLGAQDVVFDANLIEFKDLTILDANGNSGIMSSYILTDDYREFNLQSDIKVKNFQVLNTTAANNELYYGKLFVDAVAHLSGTLTAPIIELTAETTKNSDITYVYSAVSNQIESHQGIVEFIQPVQLVKTKIANEQMEKISSGLNMKIILKAEVNDRLNFKAITDPITGDYFEGKAKGDLVFVQYPNGKMELNGDLELVKGNYLFTYQKVIRRPFEVKPGGTISWTGDPLTPKLNIDVLYKVNTSPYALLGGSTEPGNSGTLQKQTFQVNLHLGGTLTKTEISTSIEYPSGNGNTNNPEISAAIDRINQDANQQNTQAFSLILFNGFLTNSAENTDFKIIDVSGNINNIITTQLNNIANRYIKFVELDFGYETGSTTNNETTTDFKVSIRKRFLNDRLTISLDGKTTTETGTDNGASQSFLDNVTIEYALTPDGRFKVKVYNTQEYDDFIQGSGVKFGGAFVFSKEFTGVRLPVTGDQ